MGFMMIFCFFGELICFKMKIFLLFRFLVIGEYDFFLNLILVGEIELEDFIILRVRNLGIFILINDLVW